MKDSTKDGIKTWLILEVLLTVLIVGKLGMAGLAALFCDASQIDDPLCEELENEETRHHEVHRPQMGEE